MVKMSEKFSSGTKKPKQTNKQSKDQFENASLKLKCHHCWLRAEHFHGCAFYPRLLSRDGTFTYYICCDAGHPKNYTNLVEVIDKQAMPRNSSNPDHTELFRIIRLFWRWIPKWIVYSQNNDVLKYCYSFWLNKTEKNRLKICKKKILSSFYYYFDSFWEN